MTRSAVVTSMPTPEGTEIHWVDLAELIILIGGALLLVVGYFRLVRGGRLSTVITLAPMPSLRLPVSDAALILILYLLMPSVAYSVAVEFSPGVENGPMSTTSEPSTSQAVSDSDAGEVNAQAERPALSRKATICAGAVAQAITILLILLIISRKTEGGLRAWGLRYREFFGRLGQALVAYLAVWPVCAGLLQLCILILVSTGLGKYIHQHSAIEALHASTDAVLLILTVVSAVVLAPVVEEFVFRGVLFRTLGEQLESPWSAAVISGAVFGLIHFTVLQSVPPLIVFGVVLAYLYGRTNSLLLPILVHVIFNAKTVLWVMLGAEG